MSLFLVIGTMWAQTVDVDMTSKVGTSKEAWNATGGPVVIDGVSMPEVFQETSTETGDVMWQTVTGLENGKYTVELWANARVAWRESAATDGQEGLTYLIANNVEISMQVLLNPGLNSNKSYVLEDVDVTDGTLKICMTKKAAGSNWHTIQIKSLTYHAPADAALNMAKEELKAALDAANAVSPKKDDFVAAITAAQNVYDSSESTDDVNAATATLKEATKLAILGNASEENPVLTDFVINGTFDSAVAPWKSTTGATNQGTASNQQGAFTGNFFENWNSNNYTGKLYQVIENIPNGVYELSICACVETFDASAQFVYANGDKVALTTGAPTAYKVRTIVKNNTIEVGFEQTVAVNRWCGIDNVSLTYYGEASNDELLNDAKKAFLARAEEFRDFVDNNVDFTLTMINQVYLYPVEDEVFGNADYDIVGLVDKIDEVTDVELLNHWIEEMDRVEPILKEAAVAAAEFSKWQGMIMDAAGFVNTYDEEKAGVAMQYMEFSLAYNCSSVDQIKDAVDGAEQAYKDFVLTATPQEGYVFDMTFKLVNPDFDTNFEGWTGTKANRIDGEGYNGVSGIAEIGEWGATSWEANMSQTVTGLPNGIYMIKASWMAERDIEMTFAANDSSKTVVGIDDTGGNIAKDGSVVEMGQGHRGWQYVEVEAIVKDGTLTITVSSSAQAQYMWSNADAFELYYAGTVLSEITLNETEAALEIGKTAQLQLTAVVAPTDATFNTLTWTSDDETVATVDSDGLVTAVGKGQAVITVTAPGGAKAECVVNVSVADAIDIVETQLSTEIYDLSGRRVEKAVKGIYIVNGKKVVK